MKLLLHIGTEKTGTTAFQKWLDKNDGILRQNGVYYSHVAGRPSNMKFPVIGASCWENAAVRYGIHDAASRQKFIANVKENLRHEIETAKRSGAHHFIISSEHLHSRVVTREGVSEIAEFLRGCISNIEVICFVRPQLELWLSLVSTLARMGYRITDTKGPQSDNIYYNYLELYKRWSHAFGHLNFIPYKRNVDIVEYFKMKMGVDGLRFEQVAWENSWIDVRAVALNHNIDLPPFIDGDLNRNRMSFVEKLERTEQLTVSRTLADDVNCRFRGLNEDLCSRVESILIDDLEVDTARYPENGNIDIIQDVPWSSHLREMVVRFNVELWFERARTKLAESERAAARGNMINARSFVDTAQKYIEHAQQGVKYYNIYDLSDATEKLQARLNKARNETEGEGE